MADLELKSKLGREKYKRGLECLELEHGRVLEYVNIEMIMKADGFRLPLLFYTEFSNLFTRLLSGT